jgi:hypothetical protein
VHLGHADVLLLISGAAHLGERAQGEERRQVPRGLDGDPQDVIFPYSAGDYIAQSFHSAKCFSTACTAAKSGKHKGEICFPTAKENLFGCNIHGTMQLNEINSTAPTTPFPPTATSTNGTSPGDCGFAQ